MKGELSLKVIRGKTGREGYHLKADRPTEHVEVQDFVLQLCRSNNTDWNRLLETNETAQRIQLTWKGDLVEFRGMQVASFWPAKLARAQSETTYNVKMP